ncbi:MAG: Uma2 family endonuclease [Candidatus Tectimicrobiota bacterium]
MTALVTTAAPGTTLADVLANLGDIAPGRGRVPPALGSATEQDALEMHAWKDCLDELVNGVLVEKATGFRESYFAGALLEALRAFERPRNLGLVMGSHGMMRLAPGLVRIPDVAFVSWERLPERRIPTAPMPVLAPDLAIEVLSAGNPPRAMLRKRQEYFAAGVRLVWFVDPEMRTVTVFTGVHQFTVLDTTQRLNGAPVLPGFPLALPRLFAELDRHGM